MAFLPGVRITVRMPDVERVRLTVIGETEGLSAVPGSVLRPSGLVAAIGEDGDLVAVTCGYILTSDSPVRWRSPSRCGRGV
ncbi:hypothetical protein [Streptosporangium roseum]|uniref:hypothetical protein n=1 Tax=Streptosporangium roseum TaxID=2001 RepID=UPI00332C454A